MLLRQISQHSLRSPDVIRRREKNLRAPCPRRDRNPIEKLERLVGINREVLLRPKDSHATTNVSRKRLDLLDRNHLHFARTGSVSQLLEVELSIAGNYSKDMLLDRS